MSCIMQFVSSVILCGNTLLSLWNWASDFCHIYQIVYVVAINSDKPILAVKWITLFQFFTKKINSRDLQSAEIENPAVKYFRNNRSL